MPRPDALRTVARPGRRAAVPLTVDPPEPGAHQPAIEAERSARRRWALPAGVVLLVGVGVAGSLLGPRLVAATGPDLAPQTPGGLVAAVSRAAGRPLSGTIRQVLDLGLPTLPTGLDGGSASLPAGPRTATFWQRSATEQRLAVLGTLSEVDVLRRGRDTWTWDSSADTVRHVVVAAAAPGTSGIARPAAAGTGSPADVGSRSALAALVGAGSVGLADLGVAGDAGGGSAPGVLDPPTAADLLLRVVGAQTSQSVLAEPVRVAGRTAYELVSIPRQPDTLVGRVTVDVDAATGVPLRVRVYARGSQSPAFATVFTAVHYDVPAASVFAFTPPAGSVTTSATAPAAAGPGTSGSSAGPGGAGTVGSPGAPGTAPQPAAPIAGSGWDSVLVSGVAGTGSRGPVALARLLGAPTQLAALLAAAAPVDGSYGHGRLLRAPLFTALVLDDGRVFAGTVDAAALERAASR